MHLELQKLVAEPRISAGEKMLLTEPSTTMLHHYLFSLKLLYK